VDSTTNEYDEDSYEQKVSPYYEDEVYTKPLSREDTLEKQIWFIAYSYSNGRWREFEYGLKALYPLLPFKVRTQFSILKFDPSPEGVEKHYQMFLEIQEKIEKDTNMIWKKRFVKTYE
jgi:hypothetical protein